MIRDTFEVRTAENVELGWDVAGIGSRLLAFVVDMLLVGLIEFCVVLLIAGLLSGTDGVGALLLLSFLTFIVYVGYFVVAEASSGGRSPGKRALHLRVIRVDGGAAGFSEALIRGLIRLVDVAVGIIPPLIIAAVPVPVTPWPTRRRSSPSIRRSWAWGRAIFPTPTSARTSPGTAPR